jgi:hypothetical protein
VTDVRDGSVVPFDPSYDEHRRLTPSVARQGANDETAARDRRCPRLARRELPQKLAERFLVEVAHLVAHEVKSLEAFERAAKVTVAMNAAGGLDARHWSNLAVRARRFNSRSG